MQDHQRSKKRKQNDEPDRASKHHYSGVSRTWGSSFPDDLAALSSEFMTHGERACIAALLNHHWNQLFCNSKAIRKCRLTIQRGSNQHPPKIVISTVLFLTILNMSQSNALDQYISLATKLKSLTIDTSKIDFAREDERASINKQLPFLPSLKTLILPPNKALTRLFHFNWLKTQMKLLRHLECGVFQIEDLDCIEEGIQLQFLGVRCVYEPPEIRSLRLPQEFLKVFHFNALGRRIPISLEVPKLDELRLSCWIKVSQFSEVLQAFASHGTLKKVEIDAVDGTLDEVLSCLASSQNSIASLNLNFEGPYEEDFDTIKQACGTREQENWTFPSLQTVTLTAVACDPTRHLLKCNPQMKFIRWSYGLDVRSDLFFNHGRKQRKIRREHCLQALFLGLAMMLPSQTKISVEAGEDMSTNSKIWVQKQTPFQSRGNNRYEYDPNNRIVREEENKRFIEPGTIVTLNGGSFRRYYWVSTINEEDFTCMLQKIRVGKLELNIVKQGIISKHSLGKFNLSNLLVATNHPIILVSDQ